MLFTIVGICLSICGMVSGIVMGITFDNFGFCLLTWISTFLYVLIYFGFGIVIKNQKMIIDKVDSIENKINQKHNTVPLYVAQSKTDSKDATQKNDIAHKWRCPNCSNMISDPVCPYCGKNSNE